MRTERVRWTAEGLRSAAGLARAKLEIVHAAGHLASQAKAVAEAFATLTDELMRVAQEVENMSDQHEVADGPE